MPATPAGSSLSSRWMVVTAALYAPVVPLAVVTARVYGTTAGMRFIAGMVSTLAVQQALLALALRRTASPAGGGSHLALDFPNVLSLSRGAVGAMLVGLLASGVRDRRGPAGWLAWLSILVGCSLTDWIDGPLTRRRGSTEADAALDLECDSWLSLTASCAGVAWGGLVRYYPAGCAGHYAVALGAALGGEYERMHAIGTSWWARVVGFLHMGVLLAASAPFWVLSQRLATPIAPFVPPFQLLCAALVAKRLRAQARTAATDRQGLLSR